jgi:hypothetical protein
VSSFNVFIHLSPKSLWMNPIWIPLGSISLLLCHLNYGNAINRGGGDLICGTLRCAACRVILGGDAGTYMLSTIHGEIQCLGRKGINKNTHPEELYAGINMAGCLVIYIYIYIYIFISVLYIYIYLYLYFYLYI